MFEQDEWHWLNLTKCSNITLFNNVSKPLKSVWFCIFFKRLLLVLWPEEKGKSSGNRCPERLMFEESGGKMAKKLTVVEAPFPPCCGRAPDLSREENTWLKVEAKLKQTVWVCCLSLLKSQNTHYKLCRIIALGMIYGSSKLSFAPWKSPLGRVCSPFLLSRKRTNKKRKLAIGLRGRNGIGLKSLMQKPQEFFIVVESVQRLFFLCPFILPFGNPSHNPQRPEYIFVHLYTFQQIMHWPCSWVKLNTIQSYRAMFLHFTRTGSCVKRSFLDRDLCVKGVMWQKTTTVWI